MPVITYSSPSRSARHAIALVSVPASGSDNDRQPRISAVARRGNHRCFCSSVPSAFSRFAAITWVLTMPESDIHPAASSSMTPM